MAKVRSVLKLSGTLSGMTFVDSKAYAPHARAKRGTYTPISMAEGMKQSAVVQTHVNQIAKVIFEAVNDFVPGFKDGKFWSRLLSLLRKQNKAGKNYDYADFSLMEVRTDYPTKKLCSFRLTSALRNGVELHYQIYKGTRYRVRLLRIASNETFQQPYPHQVLEDDIEGVGRIGTIRLSLTHYLRMLKRFMWCIVRS